MYFVGGLLVLAHISLVLCLDPCDLSSVFKTPDDGKSTKFVERPISFSNAQVYLDMPVRENCRIPDGPYIYYRDLGRVNFADPNVRDQMKVVLDEPGRRLVVEEPRPCNVKPKQDAPKVTLDLKDEVPQKRDNNGEDITLTVNGKESSLENNRKIKIIIHEPVMGNQEDTMNEPVLKPTIQEDIQISVSEPVTTTKPLAKEEQFQNADQQTKPANKPVPEDDDIAIQAVDENSYWNPTPIVDENIVKNVDEEPMGKQKITIIKDDVVPAKPAIVEEHTTNNNIVPETQKSQTVDKLDVNAQTSDSNNGVTPSPDSNNIRKLLDDSLATVICNSCKGAPKLVVTYPVVPTGEKGPKPLMFVSDCGCLSPTCSVCGLPRVQSKKFLYDEDALEYFIPPPNKMVYVDQPRQYAFMVDDWVPRRREYLTPIIISRQGFKELNEE